MEGFKNTTRIKFFKEGGAVLKDVDTDKNPGLSKLPTELRNKMGYKKDGGAIDITQDKSMVKKGVKQHETALHKGEPKTPLKLKEGGRTKKECGTVKKFDKASAEYGVKKDDADLKRIKDVKKMQYGGMTGPAPAGPAANAPSGAMSNTDAKLMMLEKQRQMEKMKRARMLSPSQQGELISQDPAAAGLSAAPVMRKKGGSAKKC
jgi:phage gp45-like